ncbi:MAG: divalent-cation tolerance protein CutA [Thermoanaerobaculum sp.]|nr:divalent-cation tolerance protein CutA [Thermoanaerobaculum sp.]
MAEQEPIIIILTSVGTETQAVEISEELVHRGLATCVNIVSCLRSIYRWKGKVCSDSEYLLFIKTRAVLFPQVADAIRELHSYELPEILAFPVTHAEATFHQWVVEMASGTLAATDSQEDLPAYD